MYFFKSIAQRIRGILQGSMARNTLWMLLAKLSSVFMQAASFVLIARSLGTEDYGTFIGITALGAIVVPFASLGSGDLLIKYTAKDRSSFQEYLGNAFVTVLIGSFILIIGTFFIAQMLLPNTISPWAVLLILIADILGLTLTFDTTVKAFLAVDLVKRAAQIQISLTLCKFIAAIILATGFQNPNTLTWAGLYFASTILAAFSAVFLLFRLLGLPQFNRERLKTIPADIRQGVHFSISLSADIINSNLDKMMLASLSTLQATGLYAAGYRLIDVSCVPLFSMLAATYSKFFQHGVAGIQGSLKFAKQLLPTAAGYGIISLLGCLIFAPVVPYLLGNDYLNVVNVLRWLAPVPFLISLQMIAGDTLTGAGFQHIRSKIQVAAAVINVVLNLYLIPLYSWKGAIWATLTSEVLKLIGLWLSVAFCYRQYTQQSQSP
jgi:O-antigen/teichoic acid export membrane protein